MGHGHHLDDDIKEQIARRASALNAYDKASGAVVWSVSPPFSHDSYMTPIVWQRGDQRGVSGGRGAVAAHARADLIRSHSRLKEGNMRTPLLFLHIVAGTLGMLSGFVAVFLRKGSRRHGIVGNVFVITMLCLSSSGTILAIMKSQPGNIVGGAVTFYFVATAWLTARRRDGRNGEIEGQFKR